MTIEESREENKGGVRTAQSPSTSWACGFGNPLVDELWGQEAGIAGSWDSTNELALRLALGLTLRDERSNRVSH